MAPTHPSNNGEPEPLQVVRVEGRYPHGMASILRSDNIGSSISPHDDGTTVIRLSDIEHDDMWIELTVRGSIAALLHK